MAQMHMARRGDDANRILCRQAGYTIPPAPVSIWGHVLQVRWASGIVSLDARWRGGCPSRCSQDDCNVTPAFGPLRAAVLVFRHPHEMSDDAASCSQCSCERDAPVSVSLTHTPDDKFVSDTPTSTGRWTSTQPTPV